MSGCRAQEEEAAARDASHTPLLCRPPPVSAVVEGVAAAAGLSGGARVCLFIARSGSNPRACLCWSWQARQLLLDPAVAREFERLRGEAEAASQEARGLREELQAAHFSQESKAGRLLMAKCRALQARPKTLKR